MVRIPPKLNAENWKELSLQDRLDTLQELENNLAADDERIACRVEAMESVGHISADGAPLRLGSRSTDAYGIQHVKINPELLQQERPYESTETLLHESRHAFQWAAVEEPSLHHDPEQVTLWEKNLSEAGYALPDENFELYWSQPVEFDARDVARERTDEIFSEQFVNQPGYADYCDKKAQEKAFYTERAEEKMGPNFKEEARQAVLDSYEAHYRTEEVSLEDGNQKPPLFGDEEEEKGEEQEYGAGF